MGALWRFLFGRTEESRSSAPLDGTDILLISVWFAVLTGLGETFLLGIKKYYLDHFIRFGPDVVWMAPLGNLCVFGIVGLSFWFAARCWPGRVSFRVVALVFSFIGLLSLLLMYSQLHRYAALLLALGLAVQTARFIKTRVAGFRRLVRLTALPLAVLVVMMALGIYGWRRLVEARALASLVGPPEAPNVLLIVLDTVRAQNLSVYGYGRDTTPHLDKLARTGVTFERAIATGPWTLPSHASMFTGRWPHELSADWFTALDEKHPTLAESLRAQGYNTAAFVANTYYCSYEQGLDRGFIYYEDYVISPMETLMSSSLVRTVVNDAAVRRALGYYDVATQKNAEEVNRGFLAWLSRNDQRPFFAFLNYFDAHELYVSPAPFDVKFGENIARERYHITFELRRALLRNRFAMSPEEIQAEMNAYDGAIAYLDHQLGLLFQELERRGVLDNTIVLITADHGEQFGEHRLNVHGNSLYLQLLHVPLLIVSPSRLPGGIRIKQPVTLRDLPATVLDLVGVRDWDARFPGDSLARFWKDTDKDANSAEDMLLSEVSGPGFGEQWYPTFKGDLKSLVVGHHHYIRNGDGREELYNFEDDPQEKRDLANSIGGAQILERCRATFEQTIVRNRPPD